MAERNNKNNKNKINYEENGVFYTPGDSVSNYNKKASFENIAFENTEEKNTQKKSPKKIPAKKSQYPVFMSLAIGCGILVFVILFIIMHNVFSPGKSSGNLSKASEETTYSYINESISEKTMSGNEYMGVIRIKSDSLTSFTIYNINSDENGEYVITGGTEMRDKYGKSIVFDEFEEGDIVYFVYDTGNILTSIKKADKGFKETLSNGFKINTTDMTISTGLKTYAYSEMTKFTYGTEEFDPNFLDSSIDIITLSGYEDKVWTVSLDKGHGELEVVQNKKIKDGIIEIDTDVYKKLSDAKTFKLNNGKHKIVVKGSNIDSFTKEIEILVNEKTTLDLNEIEAKVGKVTIRPNVTDYALYVNGNLELSREPLELEYGTYTIEIVKYGYLNYNKSFTLKSSELTLTPQLTKEIKMGTLTVNSTPTGASLTLDGTSVGSTPYTGQVSQGQHSITLKKEGYKDVTIGSINISDQEAIYNVELQKE